MYFRETTSMLGSFTTSALWNGHISVARLVPNDRRGLLTLGHGN